MSGAAVPELRFPEFEEEWITKPWKSVAPLQRGFDLPVSDFIEGSFPVVYSNGILRRHIEPKVSSPGVVTGRSGTIGKVTLVEEDYWPHNTSLWVTDFCGNDPHWISELLRRQRLEYISTGSGVPTLNRNDIHRLKISIPSLSEQKKIAAFLSAVDEKLAAVEAQLAGWREYKRGMMQALFSQTLRFKADDGSEFPDWEEAKLKDIAKSYQPKTISGSELTDSGYTVFGANGKIGFYHSYNHENEEVTVTCRGNTCGTVLLTDKKSWITGNTMVIQPKAQGQLWKRFLLARLQFDDLRYLITGSGQPQITGDISSHKIPLPSLQEQQKIADALSTIDEKINGLNDRLDATREFKRGLLQKMFV